MVTKKRDLIDRGRLLRDPYFQEGRYPESHLLRMAIREQPTVDAVEVVRCKDCRLEGTEECPMVHRDSLFGNLYAETKPDDFCSYGERRTNATE